MGVCVVSAGVLGGFAWGVRVWGGGSRLVGGCVEGDRVACGAVLRGFASRVRLC